MNRRAIARYVIVGLFWYAWHLSWLKREPLESEIVTIVFMLLASIGIGFVADRTQSILAAASFHILGNILGLTSDFKELIPSTQSRIVIAGICFVTCLVVLRIWRISDGSSEGHTI